jgi:large subunit ribosomal protein L7/L12
MSDITKEQVIDWLSGQSVIEIADLVKELEEKKRISYQAFNKHLFLLTKEQRE